MRSRMTQILHLKCPLGGSNSMVLFQLLPFDLIAFGNMKLYFRCFDLTNAGTLSLAECSRPDIQIQMRYGCKVVMSEVGET